MSTYVPSGGSKRTAVGTGGKPGRVPTVTDAPAMGSVLQTAAST